MDLLPHRPFLDQETPPKCDLDHDSTLLISDFIVELGQLSKSHVSQELPPAEAFPQIHFFNIRLQKSTTPATLNSPAQ